MAFTKKSVLSPKKSELVVPQNMPEIYADGFSAMMIGYPMSKIIFHSISMSLGSSDDEIEKRTGVAQVVLPTHSLIEFAKHILGSIEANKSGVISSVHQYQGAVLSLISNADADSKVSAELPER